MEKIYKCFISSTFRDLEEERRRVIEAVLDYHQLPVGMENFNAADETQWNYITRMLKDCDYFIVIVAHNYGTVDEDGISYTEKETRYAQEQGIPVLRFILSNRVKDWPHERYERDPQKQEKLELFKEFLASDSMVSYWEDKNDLAAKITASLRDAIEYHPRPGYVRGSLAEDTAGLDGNPPSFPERSPEFAVEFDLNIGSEFVGDPLIVLDSTKLAKVEELEIMEPLQQLSLSIPSPLENTVTECDIEAWNHNVAKYNQEIEEYNSKAAEYNHRLASVPAYFSLSNSGTKRANGIVIVMEFPEWLEVFNSDCELEKPERPAVPLNPIRAALKRLQELKHPLLFPSIKGVFVEPLHFTKTSTNISKYLSVSVDRLTKLSQSLVIQSKNTLIFNADTLQHGFELVCRKLMITPLCIGPKEGVVRISCHCDELAQPQILELPIIISRGD